MVLLQGHSSSGSGDEAEGWEGTLMTLGTLFIFSIYHLSKKKKVNLVLKVTPLSTCLFVSAGRDTLLIHCVVQFLI